MIAIFEAVLGNDKREGRTEGPSGKPRPRLKRLGAGLRLEDEVQLLFLPGADCHFLS